MREREKKKKQDKHFVERWGIGFLKMMGEGKNKINKEASGITRKKIGNENDDKKKGRYENDKREKVKKMTDVKVKVKGSKRWKCGDKDSREKNEKKNNIPKIYRWMKEEKEEEKNIKEEKENKREDDQKKRRWKRRKNKGEEYQEEENMREEEENKQRGRTSGKSKPKRQ